MCNVMRIHLLSPLRLFMIHLRVSASSAMTLMAPVERRCWSQTWTSSAATATLGSALEVAYLFCTSPWPGADAVLVTNRTPDLPSYCEARAVSSASNATTE